LSVVDQAAWAATNFLFLAMLAHSAYVDVFGEVGIAFGVVVLACGLAASTAGETSAVERGVATRGIGPIGADAIRGNAMAAVLVLAAVGGILTWGLLAAVQGGLTSMAVVLGAGTLAAVSAEGVRALLYAFRSPLAPLMSLTWLVVEAGAFAGLIMLDAAAPTAIIAGWSAGAAACLLVGVMTDPMGVRLAGALNPRRLRYGFEYLLTAGPVQLMVFLAGGMISVQASATMRALQSVFGPVNVVIQGLINVLMPRAAEHLGTAVGAGRRVAVVAVSFSIASTVVLCVPGVGSRLMAESWPDGWWTVALYGLGRAAVGATFGSLVILRANDAGARSTRLRLMTAGLVTATFAVGAAVSLDVAIGVSSLAMVICAGLWARSASRAVRAPSVRVDDRWR
jgi:hypothetical protein